MIVIGMLFYLFEMSHERILGRLLQLDIDGGADAKAFVLRPVPTYSSNDLLADVIDRVALALRVLPAADHDLLRSGGGAPFPADQAEVAHPIERVIAHFARIIAIGPRRQSVWTLD